MQRRMPSKRWLDLLVFPRLARSPYDLFQTGRLRSPGLPKVLIDLIAVVHLGSWKADQLPTDQPRVTAVHGIAEHAFDGVRAQELEEARALESLQLLVLIVGWQTC